MHFPSYVPDALARLPQWVFWQSELTPQGKPTKVPYQVNNWKRLAASTRAEEWTTFADVWTNMNVCDRSGAGFVFAEGGGIFGIDIDPIEKVAPEDQDASMRLRSLIHEHFQTYCEVSPSGAGRHYMGFGSLPADIDSIKDSKYGIEIYDHHRFFTFTGQVLGGRDVLEDCQEALTDLCGTMRQSRVAERIAIINGTDDRSLAEIHAAIAGWANGPEFLRLMNDPLSVSLGRYKGDHSAADLALFNFIATGTNDVDKAVATFRRSPLWREGGKGGYKPEQKYIDDYVLKYGMQKIWGENALKERARAIAIEEGREHARAILARADSKVKGVKGYIDQYGLQLPLLDATNVECMAPPGMAGKFVQAVHDACYTPIMDFAVVASMAFLSGISGRAYRYQGTGLNAFFMVGAKSSTGKSQSISAIARLLGGMSNPIMGERLYQVSGKTVQGMQPYFEKYPAGAWITDECGAQVKALVEPSGQGDHELKDAINSLFDAAIPGKRWRPPTSRASQKEDKSITCLSVGIGWYTTREKIYAALNDNEIADGFLSRFVPVFYNGTMGEDNPKVIHQFPKDVKAILTTLWQIVQENDMAMPMDGVTNTKKSIEVQITDDGKEGLERFSVAARNITRRAQDEDDPLPESFIAMSRVGVTAQRLAGVCAVMDNPLAPVITLEHVEWAVQLVGSRMLHVLELMASGEVGSGDRIEVPTVVRIMRRMMRTHGAGVPSAALHDKLRGVRPFKEARMGPMNMVKQALGNMVEEGRLIRDTGGISGEAGRPRILYRVTNDQIWQEE